MTSSRTPDPAAPVAASPVAAAADAGAASASRVPPLRFVAWIAIAIVIGGGVALYFRHRGEVTPLIGGVAAEGAGR